MSVLHRVAPRLHRIAGPAHKLEAFPSTSMLHRFCLFVMIALMFAGAPAAAQKGSAQKGAAPKEAPAAPAATPAAPFDKDLQLLAEILGALHYLRGLCGSHEGQKWREQMQALIDAEAPSGERHDRLVASFNRGYRGFRQTYRTCTPSAHYAIRRYLAEGATIARDITSRYAN